jgi:hypothetical protein
MIKVITIPTLFIIRDIVKKINSKESLIMSGFEKVVLDKILSELSKFEYNNLIFDHSTTVLAVIWVCTTDNKTIPLIFNDDTFVSSDIF